MRINKEKKSVIDNLKVNLFNIENEIFEPIFKYDILIKIPLLIILIILLSKGYLKLATYSYLFFIVVSIIYLFEEKSVKNYLFIKGFKSEDKENIKSEENRNQIENYIFQDFIIKLFTLVLRIIILNAFTEFFVEKMLKYDKTELDNSNLDDKLEDYHFSFYTQLNILISVYIVLTVLFYLYMNWFDPNWDRLIGW